MSFDEKYWSIHLQGQKQKEHPSQEGWRKIKFEMLVWSGTDTAKTTSSSGGRRSLVLLVAIFQRLALLLSRVRLTVSQMREVFKRFQFSTYLDTFVDTFLIMRSVIGGYLTASDSTWSIDSPCSSTRAASRGGLDHELVKYCIVKIKHTLTPLCRSYWSRYPPLASRVAGSVHVQSQLFFHK